MPLPRSSERLDAEAGRGGDAALKSEGVGRLRNAVGFDLGMRVEEAVVDDAVSVTSEAEARPAERLRTASAAMDFLNMCVLRMSGGCGSAPLGRFNVSAFRTRSLNFVRRLQMSEVRRNSGRGKSALPGVFFKFRSAAGGCGRTGNGVLFLELVRTDEEECRVFRTSVVARTCEE